MTTGPTPPRTLRARTPEDLLAMAPLLLGFFPADSVVLLTFGADRPFHARVDLPDDPDDLPAMTDTLVGPALRHGVEGAVVLVYTRVPERAEAALDHLCEAFEEIDVTVLEALRADGERWFGLLPARGGPDVAGTPYDVSSHPFTAQAVMDGHLTHHSREELAGTLVELDPERRRPVAEAAARLEPPSPRQRRAEGGWLASAVRRHVEHDSVPDAEETARMLVAVADAEVRDEAWLPMTRADADRHVRLWTAVVRNAPGHLVPGAAAVLGFAAWLAGRGALAWCALDRCLEVAPRHSLGTLVAGMLADAVPPQVWEECRADVGRAGA